MLLESMIIDDLGQHEGANLGKPDSARGQQKFRTGDISRFATLNGNRVILVPEDVELRHRAKGTIRWRSKAGEGSSLQLYERRVVRGVACSSAPRLGGYGIGVGNRGKRAISLPVHSRK